MVIGLAIYNAHTLNIAFAPAVYKQLLGQRVQLDDLREVEPEVYISLSQLLHYPADKVEADMCLTFQVRGRSAFLFSEHVPGYHAAMMTNWSTRTKLTMRFARCMLQRVSAMHLCAMPCLRVLWYQSRKQRCDHRCRHAYSTSLAA